MSSNLVAQEFTTAVSPVEAPLVNVSPSVNLLETLSVTRVSIFYK